MNILPPRTTFEDDALLGVLPKIRAYSIKYERTYIVFDVYRPSSLKAESRSKRGHGARRMVTSRCKGPSNWPNFLGDNDNKTDLFNFLADKIEHMPSPNNGDRDQRRECTQQPYDQPRRRVPLQSRGSRHTDLCKCQACSTGRQ